MIRAAAAAVAVVVAGAFGLALWPRMSSHFGYATPLGMPDRIHVAGRDYLDPVCAKAGADELPLRRIGSVPGFLTGSKPILVPRSMPRGLDPTYLYVRAGCLYAYDLSGGP